MDKWRTEKQARCAGGRPLLSKQVGLSDGQLQKLADHGSDFLREVTVTADLICKFVPWNLASQDDLKAVESIIMNWRVDAQLAIGLTPRGRHRQKQQNTMSTPPRAINHIPQGNMQSITQPSFAPAHMPRGCLRSQGARRGRGHGAAPARTAPANNADFFGPVATAPVPQTMSTHSGFLPPSAPSQSNPHPAPSTSTLHNAHPPNMPYNLYAAYMYNSAAGLFYPQMYPMYSLPPRYYPVPNTQNQNR